MEPGEVNSYIKQEIIEIETSDSSQEEDIEEAHVAPQQTNLAGALGLQIHQASNLLGLQVNETSSTVSTTEPQFEVYTYQLPESTENSLIQQTNDFSGEYDFRLIHPREESTKPTKSASWTYSPYLEELYVKMNTDCPIRFQVKGSPPMGSYIRTTPYYLRPEDANSIPTRCLNHSSSEHETNRDHSSPEHLIRCSTTGTEYVTDSSTGRMSTILPYLPPEMVGNQSTYVIRFMCRTSCPGGMNRRPIYVLFTLEHEGRCLGRMMRKVKVCACPGRDRHQEETRLEMKTFGTTSSGHKTVSQEVKRACKRIGSGLGNPHQAEKKRRKTYTITVNSKSKYNILSALVPILDMNMGNDDVSSDEEQ